MCDDGFNNTDAKVVCRQLGYSTLNAVALGNAYYGRGIGTIWLDDVRCSGSESNLTDCSNSGWANDDCSHHEDVSVECSKLIDAVAVFIVYCE